MSGQGRDLRLPLLAAVLVLAAGIYAWRNRPVPPAPPDPPALILEQARTLHAAVVRADGTTDTVLLARALERYRAALTSAEPDLSREAHYGAGQLLILSGDTNAAIAEWTNIPALNGGDFEALRAYKSLSEACRAERRLPEARAWDMRIVEVFGDSDLPQAMSVIVEAARKRTSGR